MSLSNLGKGSLYTVILHAYFSVDRHTRFEIMYMHECIAICSAFLFFFQKSIFENREFSLIG